MNEIITVTQLVTAINFTLETLTGVKVQGEVDDFKIIQGKWVTFALKDEESTINCFMPVWQYRTQVENGMLVTVTGQPRLRNKGFFSFVLESVQPAGEGALKRALQLLQQKLQAEGLFDQMRKRSLPSFPAHIALITSRDAAAYSDFLKVLQHRQGGLHISFIHTQVQGEDAPRQIIEAITTANTELSNVDVVVLVRGGGSLEDLMAFNDEQVVRAVAASRTPIVVGIGHERDITLAELAADMRASTPSNAAELLVRSRQEIAGEITAMTTTLHDSIHEAIRDKKEKTREHIVHIKSHIITTVHHISRRIDSLTSIGQRLVNTATEYNKHLTAIHTSMHRMIQQTIQQNQQNTSSLQRALTALSPSAILQRGYSITRRSDGSLVRSTQDAPVNEELMTTVEDGEIISRVSQSLKKKADTVG